MGSRALKAALALVAAMVASGLHGATGEAAGTLLRSNRAEVAAAAKPAYESTFTPMTALPAQVKAPSVKQTAAFAALNALLSAQTRFSEDLIGMSVSLQRAQRPTPQAHSCGTCARRTPVPSTPGSRPPWSRGCPPYRRPWPGRSSPTR